MDEYIKRDAALKALLQVSAPTPDESHIVEKCVEKVNRLPMMEVVRCKDCKYYSQNPWNTEKELLCKCWCDWLHTSEDDFCSNGERRAGE